MALAVSPLTRGHQLGASPTTRLLYCITPGTSVPAVELETGPSPRGR